MDENQLNEFKVRFVEDAVRLLETLEKDLLRLEKSPDDLFLIEEVFRCMHTLKGTSGMYGFNNVEELTHQLESIYDLIRENKLKISFELIEITLTAGDVLSNLLRNNDKADKASNNKLKQIKNFITQNNFGTLHDSIANTPTTQNNKVAKRGFATWQITFNPQETIIAQNINLVNTFRDLFSLGKYNITHKTSIDNRSVFIIFLFTDKKLEDIEDALIFILDYCKILKIADFDIFDQESIERALQQQDGDEDNESHDDFSDAIVEYEPTQTSFIQARIGVDPAKLDELMFLVSELITTNSQLVLASREVVYKPLLPLFEKIDKLSKQFRNNTISLRLVPINDMVVRFQRLVRDLSSKLGKEVELLTQGTDTELDKSTIDSLVDPMMHIIRNCIDHGIEKPEIREAQKKPRKGVVKIGAYYSGNFVFLQVQDDGKGIDPDFIRRKAIEKGFISDSTVLTEKEIYELIFLPGFSTAESLTEVSGRGVGMDVVRKKITDLRGQVEISSELGLGTSFTIKLHQTIAILDTMLFRMGGMFFMVPLSDVEECRLVDFKELGRYNYTRSINWNGNLIPFVDLCCELNLPAIENNSKAKLLIINRQNNYFAISADQIIGEHQAVLKSIGEAARNQPFIALASVLGDGNLAYLLDMGAVQNQLIINKNK